MPYCTELLVGILLCLHIIFCLVVLHFYSQKCTFTEVPHAAVNCATVKMCPVSRF